MANDVTFDLQLAISGYTKSLQKANSNMGRFTDQFDKSTKKMNFAWSSFVGNLAANAVSFAARGIADLTSGMISFTKEAILAAVNAQETASKFNAVFSGISKSSEDAAKDLQRNFGLGVNESKELLSATGDLLTGFGFAQEGALGLSVDVQRLAVDLASFTNFSGGAQGASEAITKALLGETESMKSLGVSIRQTDVEAQVAINTTNGLVFETKQQAKAQATLDLIMKQSVNAIGDYAKTSGGASNQLKLFNKKIEDLTIMFGENFLPVLEPVIKMVNDFIDGLDQNAVNVFVKDGLVSLVEGFSTVITAINPLLKAVNLIGTTFKVVFNGFTAGLAILGTLFEVFAIDMTKQFINMLNTLPDVLVPDSWKKGLDKQLIVQEERLAKFKDQVVTDSGDMKNAMNDIFNPEDVLSNDTISTIVENANKVKDGIIKSKNDVDEDQQKRLALEAKNIVKKKSDDKKLQDDKNLALLKQSNFEIALFGKTQDSMTAWQNASGKERADNLKSTLGTISSLTQSNNNTLQTIGKAAAISTATIDGFTAVNKALASAPPPFNFVLAGLVGTAATANVAKIAGVNFANGGIVGGSSFTGDNVGVNVNSSEMILNRGQQNQLFQLANGSGGAGNGDLISAINSLGDRIMNMEIVLQADDEQIARSARRGFESGIEITRT